MTANKATIWRLSKELAVKDAGMLPHLRNEPPNTFVILWDLTHLYKRSGKPLREERVVGSLGGMIDVTPTGTDGPSRHHNTEIIPMIALTPDDA